MSSTRNLRPRRWRPVRPIALEPTLPGQTGCCTHSHSLSGRPRTGVGATVDLSVGGKSHPNNGPPVPMHAAVAWAGEGRFTYEGPMWRGRDDNLGPTALVRQGGVQVVLITHPQQPIDLSLTKLIGLD